MTTKQKNERILTPVGTLDWPYLTQVDKGFDSAGVYKTNIMFEDGPEAAALLNKLMVYAEAAYNNAVKAAQGKPNARRPEKASLPMFQTASGQWMLKAKLNATGTKRETQEGFTQAPRIFDSSNRPWDLTKNIYTGTTARLFVEVIPFNSPSPSVGAGISLRLKDIQILKLSEGKAGGDSPFGAAPQEALQGAEESSFGVIPAAGEVPVNADFE